MPAKFRVRVARAAENDVKQICSYVSSDNPAAGDALLDELDRQVSALEHFPERCPLIPENELLGTSYRHLIHGNYRTIFRVDARTVHVLRVIHGARLLDTAMFEE
ncbi:MAG: plasmid stabilization system [Acidobacteriales bacterium]|nr:plasmid stabilization system [Terriglobales bacterium]